jgi:hypothetical protein
MRATSPSSSSLPDQDSLFSTPLEPGPVLAPRPRRLGRVAVIAILVLVAQGSVFWHLHRASAARRRQVESDMQAFEMRAHALRTEMKGLQAQLGQTQGRIDQLHASAASRPRTAQDTTTTSARPSARPAKPRPPRATREEPRTVSARPAPIILRPGCTSQPLGC